MAKPKALMDLTQWEDFMEDISKEFGDEKLLEAGKVVIEESVKFVNMEVGKALKNSKFHFRAGEGYSQGKTRKSLIEVSKMPIEVVGTTIKGYAGINSEEAPEGLILAISGSPSGTKDTQLSNAIRVKGKTKSQLTQLQGALWVRYWRGLL